MSITWILVANASLARLYANLGPNKGLNLVKELIHPESRRKNSELVTDRPGSMANGSKQPQTTPKAHEAQVFAHQLAQELYRGRATNAFSRAILVAPPGFMGLLNTVMDGPTAQLVASRLEKDYTKASGPELNRHLASHIFL